MRSTFIVAALAVICLAVPAGSAIAQEVVIEAGAGWTLVGRGSTAIDAVAEDTTMYSVPIDLQCYARLDVDGRYYHMDLLMWYEKTTSVAVGGGRYVPVIMKMVDSDGQKYSAIRVDGVWHRAVGAGVVPTARVLVGSDGEPTILILSLQTRGGEESVRLSFGPTLEV